MQCWPREQVLYVSDQALTSLTQQQQQRDDVKAQAGDTAAATLTQIDYTGRAIGENPVNKYRATDNTTTHAIYI